MKIEFSGLAVGFINQNYGSLVKKLYDIDLPDDVLSNEYTKLYGVLNLRVRPKYVLLPALLVKFSSRFQDDGDIGVIKVNPISSNPIRSFRELKEGELPYRNHAVYRYVTYNGTASTNIAQPIRWTLTTTDNTDAGA